MYHREHVLVQVLSKLFHKDLKNACDRHNKEYYKKFKEWADKYFYLEHRNETRGDGGIFFDYLNNGNWKNDFNFVKDIGKTFLKSYSNIVRKNLSTPWNKHDRRDQLIKRGRYVEFNLLYDRGTIFGLKTGGNVEAILMSLPPEVIWN